MTEQPELPGSGSPTTPALIERLTSLSKTWTAPHTVPCVELRALLRAAADALRSLPPDKLANLCETCRLLLPFTPNAHYDPGNGCWQCAHQNQLAQLEAEVARLTDERDTLQALWTEVGQHINAAAIGYNHPQILGVFTMNRAFKAERRQLLDRAETAESEVARLTQARDAAIAQKDQWVQETDAYYAELQAKHTAQLAEYEHAREAAVEVMIHQMDKIKALHEALAVAANSLHDVVTVGRFAAGVNPARWCQQLEQHCREAMAGAEAGPLPSPQQDA